MKTTHGRLDVDDLMIRVLNGKASPFEEERMRRWRSESTENEACFQESAGVWALTAPEPATSTSAPPSVEEIMQAAEPQRKFQHRSKGRPWFQLGAIAASVAAVAIGVRAIAFAGPVVLATHQAPENQSLTVTLTDGSFVRLAAGSRLEELTSEGGREVSLDGRGFFAIARDEARPFTVNVGEGRVSVLGTRFEVSEEEGEVRTVVVEGLVAVSNDEGSVEVAAGEIARMEDGGVPEVNLAEDVYSLLHWQNGTLIFQGSRLSQVASEVSRHYGMNLEIEEGRLEDRRITAWFGGETFDEVAESLCLVVEAECQTLEQGVRMGLGAVVLGAVVLGAESGGTK